MQLFLQYISVEVETKLCNGLLGNVSDYNSWVGQSLLACMSFAQLSHSDIHMSAAPMLGDLSGSSEGLTLRRHCNPFWTAKI